MKINNESINKNPKNTTYPAIDLAKLIAAILVVAIHVAPFGSDPAYKEQNFVIRQYLTRGAVPFFFVCSGFFLYRKCDSNNYKFNHCLDYIKKLLRLYITWTIIYSFYIIKNIMHGRKTIWDVLLETIFSGSYLHLWFFTALITGVIIVSWLLSKKLSPMKICLTGGIFYLIGLMGQAYYVIPAQFMSNHVVAFIFKWYPKIFINTRNGLFEGFFFVSIGLLFASKEIKIPFKLATILMIVSELLVILETTYIDKHGWHMEEDLYLSLIPLVFFTFYVISHIDISCDTTKKSGIYNNIRYLSSLIFYLQLIVLAMYKQILSLLGIAYNPESSFFIPVLIITIISSEIIIILSEKKPFTILKKLYS